MSLLFLQIYRESKYPNMQEMPIQKKCLTFFACNFCETKHI